MMSLIPSLHLASNLGLSEKQSIQDAKKVICAML